MVLSLISIDPSLAALLIVSISLCIFDPSSMILFSISMFIILDDAASSGGLVVRVIMSCDLICVDVCYISLLIYATYSTA